MTSVGAGLAASFPSTDRHRQVAGLYLPMLKPVGPLAPDPAMAPWLTRAWPILPAR